MTKTPDTGEVKTIEFINKYPDDKEWSAHINILNKWTPADMLLRHIVGYVRSGPHYPKHFHQDLIEQYYESIMQDYAKSIIDTIAANEGWEDSRDFYAQSMGLPFEYRDWSNSPEFEGFITKLERKLQRTTSEPLDGKHL